MAEPLRRKLSQELNVLNGMALLLCVGYVLLVFFAYLFGSLFLRGAAVLVGVSVFAWLVVSRRITVELALPLLLLASSVIGIALLNSSQSEYRSLFLILVVISSAAIAWLAFEERLTFEVFELPFFVLLLFTFYLVVLGGYGAFEFNSLLAGSSRNVYSSILIACAFSYYLSRVYRGQPIPVWPFFLLLLLSFPVYSRSGILIAGALLFMVLVRKGASALVLFFMISLVLIGASGEYLTDVFLNYTNFDKGLETERYDIWSGYFYSLNLNSFFAGVPLDSVSIVDAYGGNPHNAFIRLHALWGVGVLLFLGILAYSFFRMVEDGRYDFAFMLLLVVARAFFDIVFFFNLADFFVFPLVFYFAFRGFFKSQYSRGQIA